MKYIVYVLVLIGTVAHASGKREGNVDVDVHVDAPTHVPVDVQVPVDVNAPVTVETPEINVGGTEVNTPLSVESPVSVNAPTEVNNVNQTRVPRQVPDAFFSYTPNYIDCGRVLGFQYGNTSGVGSIGIPLPRDRSCDVWLAVNEAQQNGHVLLSYAFMCEIRNIRQVWGKARCNELTETAGEWWKQTFNPDVLLAPTAKDRQLTNLQRDVRELHSTIQQLSEMVDRQRSSHESIQRIEQTIIDEGEERRRRALEQLKKGGIVPEEK